MNVRSLCLGALCLQDSSGYDIKKLFESAFSHFQSASYGSIYPALYQLEQQGLVSQRIEQGQKHPDRKVYSVTSSGRSQFLDTLASTPPAEQVRSDFMVLMFFAHLLPRERLAAILDEVEQHYRKELEYLESIEGRPGHTAGIDFSIGAGIAAVRASLQYLCERREWLLTEHRNPPKSAPEKPHPLADGACQCD